MKNFNKLTLATLISAVSVAHLNVASAADSLTEASANNKAQPSIRVNKTKIRQLQQKLQAQNDQSLKKALQLAQENNWALRKEMQDGRIVELVGVDPFNQPIYLTTYNTVAADTINTDEVWKGGSSMLALDGEGLTIGVWDGGAVRTTHQEFNHEKEVDKTGTVTFKKLAQSRVTQKDKPAGLNNHATHVTGTIAAVGQHAPARGMTEKSTIHAYDWNSDDTEMLAEAAGGLLVSNHSYGFVVGWSLDNMGDWVWNGDDRLSTDEDFRFGWYNNSSASWDSIAEAAPHYLIVKAAGNDQGNGPAKLEMDDAPRDCEFDGFDCIGPQGISKNILTIGAVKDIVDGYTKASDVVAASFTSFGPADDGRIKPDLVANGVEVLSTHGTIDDDRYYSISGTSMATPGVTGSLALLQQHYKALNDYYMLSASLKGVAIHTASEAGSHTGPDYKFGWGLMNTKDAAKAISDAKRDEKSGAVDGALIAELSAFKGDKNDNETLTIELEPEGSSLEATIVWTDPAGTPFDLVTNAHDNRNALLVNDLDMVIIETTGSGETKHLPYVLDPKNPANAATRADNDRDNVEKIEIAKINKGSSYELQVSFDENQTGDYITENFSLIVSGLKSPSCFAPREVSIDDTQTTHESITVAWKKPLKSEGDIYVNYREAGKKDWTDVKATDNNKPLKLENLEDDKNYEVRVRFDCGTDSKLYSTVVSEKTKMAPAPAP